MLTEGTATRTVSLTLGQLEKGKKGGREGGREGRERREEGGGKAALGEGPGKTKVRKHMAGHFKAQVQEGCHQKIKTQGKHRDELWSHDYPVKETD